MGHPVYTYPLQILTHCPIDLLWLEKDAEKTCTYILKCPDHNGEICLPVAAPICSLLAQASGHDKQAKHHWDGALPVSWHHSAQCTGRTPQSCCLDLLNDHGNICTWHPWHKVTFRDILLAPRVSSKQTMNGCSYEQMDFTIVFRALENICVGLFSSFFGPQEVKRTVYQYP